jgi:hypothetical protein
LEKCENGQEKIESLLGTLFWREAYSLGKDSIAWKNIGIRLENQSNSIHNLYVNDKIWNTEDGSWGYNETRTGYLINNWLAYWNYIWEVKK